MNSAGEAQRIDVLHITFLYWPEALGGTEIYVKNLAAELAQLGLRSAIAAPGKQDGAFSYEGIPVRIIRAELDTDQLYGCENPSLTAAWMAIAEELRPTVVHVHARTPALHSHALAQFRALGIKIVFTVHTPTAFCQRGTMLEFGRSPCDGRVSLKRCSACSLQGMGLPTAVAKTLPALPKFLRQGLATLSPQKLATALNFPEKLSQSLVQQRAFFDAADQVIAVCDWIACAVRVNQFGSKELILNRQGVRSDLPPPMQSVEQSSGKALRLFALGRPDPSKGFECLTEAVLTCLVPIELDLALACNGPEHPWVQNLLRRIARHPASSHRIRLHFNVPASELGAHFGACEIVAVPSIWLETGPLTVLEAFFQGKPVLGSRRGGIEELVRDGTDGWLLEPGSVPVWRNKLQELAENPLLIANARAQIRAVRTMAHVATEHLPIYRQLGINSKSATP